MIKKEFFIILLVYSIMPFAFADVLIQNDQKYIGDDKSVHIVGEVVNNLSVPINQIYINVEIFNKDENFVTLEKTNSLIHTIMPGMKSPFDLVLTNHEIKNVGSYSLKLDYQLSYPKNQVIDVSQSEMARDRHDNLVITGTVTNRGDITANNVAVVATLYDKKGKIAAVSMTHPKPDYLGANDNTFFIISIPDKVQTINVVDYTLVAESEEYAAVPEFPLGSIVLLACILVALIIITKHSNKFITNSISVVGQR